jgi:hypothetical protein
MLTTKLYTTGPCCIITERHILEEEVYISKRQEILIRLFSVREGFSRVYQLAMVHVEFEE